MMKTPAFLKHGNALILALIILAVCLALVVPKVPVGLKVYDTMPEELADVGINPIQVIWDVMLMDGKYYATSELSIDSVLEDGRILYLGNQFEGIDTYVDVYRENFSVFIHIKEENVENLMEFTLTGDINIDGNKIQVS